MKRLSILLAISICAAARLFSQGVIFFSWENNGAEAIYRINPDGTNLQRLSGYDFTSPNFESGPVIRRDGSRLAFLRGGSGPRTLMTMDPDGSNRSTVISDVNGYCSLEWSPDGSQIVLQNWAVCGEGLYIINADGTGWRKLVDAGSPISGNVALYPSWSLQGKIAFISINCGYAMGSMYTINPDGSGLQFVRSNVLRAAWSPDGSKFALELYDPEVGLYQVYTMNADGSNLQRLSTPRNGGYPAWSPDGTKIVFVQSRTTVADRDWDLWTMNADGSGQTLLVPSGYVRIAVWGVIPLPKGSIAGTISVSGTGLSGVTVRLLGINGLPVPSFDPQVTDASGRYAFSQVPAGSYQIMTVEPLGYAADQNPKSVTVNAGATSTIDFTLTYTVLSDKAEKWSYWKNQFDKAVKGKKTDETPANLTQCITTIQEHYTPHFNFFAFASFEEWQQVLSKPTHPTKRDEALAEVAALVLNFGSLKLGQYTAITEDGRTAGEVLTYVSSLIANPLSTDTELELAKKLAEKADHGDNQKIKAGEVPASTVLYKGSMKSIDWGFDVPNSYALYNNYPNPFNPSTTIQYDLPKAAYVSLKVYDVVGKEVATLVNGEIPAGRHLIQYHPTDLASGVYFYRLQAGIFVQTRKLLLLR